MRLLPVLSLLAACDPDGSSDTGVASWEDPFTPDQAERVLAMSPLPPPPPDPTNAWADDPKAAHLGQWLYFDARFSGNGEVSCATCHDPEKGWSDDLQLSRGIAETARHAPSIWNTAYNRWMFWDGRADSHWAQALKPMEDAHEAGFDRLAAVHLVQDDADLHAAFEAVFGAVPDFSDRARFPDHGKPVGDPSDPMQLAWDAMDPADQDLVDLWYSRVGKAIAAFERTVVTRHAPIDDWVAAYRAGDTATLAAADPAIAEGLQIFAGRGNCHLCHLGADMTNGEFHNIGLGPRDWLDAGDRGRFDGIPTVLADVFNGAGPYSDDPAAGDLKLGNLVQTGESMGQYKVPSLRNVATQPLFMHGGQFASLTEVVTYYSKLDEQPDWGHREDLMQELDLSDDEIASVVTLLESFTGDDTDAIPTGPPASPIP